MPLTGFLHDDDGQAQAVQFEADGQPHNRHVADLSNLLLVRNPVEPVDIVKNLGLWHPYAYVTRLLYLHDVYRRILNIPGVIIEAGVRWGQDLVWLTHLRRLLEPDHAQRIIVGFDTFTGHTGHTAVDGGDEMVQDGAFPVVAGYPAWLQTVLDAHNTGGEVFVISGDIRETLPGWLDLNPGLQVALLILDVDLYAPTAATLEAAEPRMSDGGLVVFDELSNPRYPGETVAFREWGGGRACLGRYGGAAGGMSTVRM